MGCPGLADAVEHADEQALSAAIAAAAALTPPGTTDIVLGCTHYELVADPIRAAVAAVAHPDLVLHGSAEAVAAQALRRLSAETLARTGGGTLTVLHAGQVTPLPPVAARYPQGRALQPDARPDGELIGVR